ncbi:acyltransferase family protein [Nocardioides currus]|uniref:acyltransferase family protein n=1 Tax=Nocardioides currus TaxID=2133958 RepID=UPI001403FBBF|nr:acyltransferase [Nocardioides currus]
MTAPAGARRRLPPLPWSDGIRGVALVVVVVWHAVLTVVPADPTPVQHALMLPLGVAARLSLLSFIVLSGFLLGRHWDGDLRRFTLRRCWRILPPYWIAVLLTIAAMAWLGLAEPHGSHWDTGLPFTPERTWATLLLVTDLAGMVPISHPLWTVPVELHLYLLAPLVVLFRREATVLVAGVLGTLAIAFLAPGFIAPHFVLAFMAAFWSGVRRQRPLEVTPAFAGAIGASFLLVAGAVLLLGDLSSSATRYLVVDCVVAPVLLLWILRGDLVGGPSALRDLLARRGPQRLGSRSYSTYLLHAVALELVWRAGVDEVPGETAALVVMCLLGLLASLVAGELLFRAVEAPCTARAASVRRTLPRERRPA